MRLTHNKLREADFFLRALTNDESEWMEQEPEAGDFYLSAFMSAARQVTYVLEGVAEYKQWSKCWFAERPNEDEDLHKFFVDQRNKLQHEGAADLEKVTITDVSLGQFVHEMSRPGGPGGTAFVSGAPGAPGPTFTKSEFRFAGRAKDTVVDACRRYLDLLKQLVRDFERDHPGTGNG